MLATLSLVCHPPVYIPTVSVKFVKFELQGLGIDDVVPEFGKTVGEELLTPTLLYPKAVLPLIQKEQVKGMAHITGGGFYESIPRV